MLAGKYLNLTEEQAASIVAHDEAKIEHWRFPLYKRRRRLGELAMKIAQLKNEEREIKKRCTKRWIAQHCNRCDASYEDKKKCWRGTTMHFCQDCNLLFKHDVPEQT